MKRYAKYASLVLTVILLASCDNSFRKTRIVDATVESISANGFRGLDATLNITADNPGKAFRLEDVNITANYRKAECLHFTCEEVTVEGKSQKTYSVPVHGNLNPDFSLMSFMTIMSGNFDISDFELNVNMTVITSGGKQKIKLKEIPADKILTRL